MISRRTRLVFFLFGLALVQGLFVNLMPVMFTTMEEEFHVVKAEQALLKSYFFAGSALALVVAGYLTQLWGPRRITVLSGIIAGTGAAFFGLSPQYSLVLLAASVLAIGIAPMAAIYAAVITAEFRDIRQRMYMWTYGVMAASATVATTALGALLDALGDYRPIFLGLGLFTWGWMAFVLAIGWSVLVRQKTAAGSESAPEGRSWSQRLAALWHFLTSGVFTRGALYLMCILMVFDYLCSSNIMAWTPRLFEQFYGARKILGGSALSASSAGVLVGRLIMGCLPPGRIPDRVLLAVCYTSGVLCFGLIILLQPSYAGSMLLMFLSGAFIAAQAPTMASLAVAKFGERAPVVIPLYEAVGTVAGIVGPPVVGALADRAGELAPVLWLVPIGGLALGTVAIVWEFYDRRQIA
jgi:MFS family permease